MNFCLHCLSFLTEMREIQFIHKLCTVKVPAARSKVPPCDFDVIYFCF